MASLEVLRALMTVCCLALYVYAQSGRGAPIDTSNANQPVRGSIPPSRYKDPDQGVKTPYLSNQRPDPKRGIHKIDINVETCFSCLKIQRDKPMM